MRGFAMNDSRNIIVIKSLKQGIVCPNISVKLFRGNIGPSVLITRGALNGLVTAFATRLLKDYKNTIILTFHIEKLRPSNLGG